MSGAAISALVRAGLRSALSYRLRFVVSTLSVLVMIVPLYFVSRAVQPIAGPAILNEGVHYFAFITLGLFAMSVVAACTNALPDAISSHLNSGFFEAVVSTPSGPASVAVGMSGYAILQGSLRGLVLLLGALFFGIQLVWSRVPEALLIVLLIVLAHFGVALVAAALVVAFRTQAGIPQAVLIASSLLGGVYYPTSVIPSWIQSVSDAVPLAYGLRALRHTLLDGQRITMVLGDLAALATFSLVLLTLGSMAYRGALQYARRAGSLSQY